jgi:hypothetical protein
MARWALGSALVAAAPNPPATQLDVTPPMLPPAVSASSVICVEMSGVMRPSRLSEPADNNFKEPAELRHGFLFYTVALHWHPYPFSCPTNRTASVELSSSLGPRPVKSDTPSPPLVRFRGRCSADATPSENAATASCLRDGVPACRLSGMARHVQRSAQPAAAATP